VQGPMVLLVLIQYHLDIKLVLKKEAAV